MGGEGKGHRKKKSGRKAEKRKAAEGKKKTAAAGGGDGDAGAAAPRKVISDEQASGGGGLGWQQGMRREAGRDSRPCGLDCTPKRQCRRCCPLAAAGLLEAYQRSMLLASKATRRISSWLPLCAAPTAGSPQLNAVSPPHHCRCRPASRTPRPLCFPPGARPSCSRHAPRRRSSGACTVRQEGGGQGSCGRAGGAGVRRGHAPAAG